MKIGLTGSIACGKSTVSAYLRETGIPVVDADAISHALTAPGGVALPALRDAFGDAIFDGSILNRRALGSLVFSVSSQLERLNAILHPMIIAEIRAQLDALERTHPLVVGDVPLLFECGMEHLFDRIWVVSVPQDVQIVRIMERDHLTEEEAMQRISAQMPLCEKESRADAVICSDGPIEATQAQVRALIDRPQQRRQA